MIRLASQPESQFAIDPQLESGGVANMLSIPWEENPLPSNATFRWSVAGFVGFFLCLGIFMLIAMMIPESDSLKPPDLSQILKITFQPENLKPPASNSRKENSQKELRPLEEARKEPPSSNRKSVKPRSTARQARSNSAARPSAFRPSSGMGLGNLSIAGAGGGGPAINMRDLGESLETAVDTIEMARYNDRRARSKQGQYIAREVATSAGIGSSSDSATARESPPMPVYTPKPEYTRQMREKGVEGFVLLKVLVSRTGSVEQHEILASEPEGEFELVVKRVIPQWRFSPAKDAEGRPIEAWEEFELIFSLEDQ